MYPVETNLEQALKVALISSNERCKKLEKELEMATRLSERAVDAYQLLTDDYEHAVMENEHLRDRLAVRELLEEFEL